jgi:hypothetical protein
VRCISVVKQKHKKGLSKRKVVLGAQLQCPSANKKKFPSPPALFLNESLGNRSGGNTETDAADECRRLEQCQEKES